MCVCVRECVCVCVCVYLCLCVCVYTAQAAGSSALDNPNQEDDEEETSVPYQIFGVQRAGPGKWAHIYMCIYVCEYIFYICSCTHTHTHTHTSFYMTIHIYIHICTQSSARPVSGFSTFSKVLFWMISMCLTTRVCNACIYIHRQVGVLYPGSRPR